MPGAGSGARADAAFERPGDEIGPYRLISLLGEGGFGSVWLAERRRPFVQRVALKVIKAGMDSRAVIGRFEQERQALAVMAHPNIAKVLDGGVTGSGRPYFAMEHVAGEPITDYCDRRRLSIDARLRLFELACEAVQHAHLKGIIHRDLKPGNILAFDVEGGDPSLKIIDFGIAKAVSPGASAHTVFTETGQMIGSMDYMSPEQADPTGAGIDTRTDIYSLGVLLYELVTGALPFEPSELRSKAYREVQRIIQEEDPPTPSARLSTIATRDHDRLSRIERARGIKHADLVADLRRELEWIPLKAIRKEPRLRYQSAMDLAEDIRNYRQGKPLVAAPESPSYRLRKYLRRHRTAAIAVTGIAASVVIGAAAAIWQWRVARASEADAIRARDEAVALRAEAESQARRAELLLQSLTAGRALQAGRAGATESLARDLEVATQLGVEGRFEFRLARAMADSAILDLRPAKGHVTCVAASPDGRLVAAGTDKGEVAVWDSASGALRGTIALPGDSVEPFVLSVAFLPDSGSMIVSSQGSQTDSTPVLSRWDLAGMTEVGARLTGPPAPIVVLRQGALGGPLVGAASDGSIWAWDAAGGQAAGRALGRLSGRVQSLAVSPSGHRAFASTGGAGVFLDPVGGVLAGELKPLGTVIAGAAFDPSGATLATGLLDGSVQLIDVATALPLGERLRDHRGAVSGVAFLPDGSRLVTASWDGTIRAWDLASRRAIGASGIVGAPEMPVGLVPIGADRVACAGGERGGAVGVWNVREDRAVNRVLPSPDGGTVQSVRFAPDGSLAAILGERKSVHLIDPASGAYVGCPIGEDVASAAWLPDGATLAVLGSDGALRFVDPWSFADRRKPIEVPGMAADAFDIDPAGRLVALKIRAPGSVAIADLATGGTVGEPIAVRSLVGAAFLGDGKEVLVAAGKRLLRIDAASGRVVREAGPLESDVRRVRLSSDRASALVELANGHFRLDTASLAMGATPLKGHEGGIRTAAWSADGKTLATSGSADKTLRLSSVEAMRDFGEPLATDIGVVPALAFSPSGSMLVAAGPGVRFWDAVPVRERMPAIRARLAQVEAIRRELAPVIAAAGTGSAQVRAAQAHYFAGGAVTGDRRIAAAIVFREEFDARRKAEAANVEATRAKRQRIEAALGAGEIERALAEARPCADEIDSAQLFNQLAWLGTTRLEKESQARDLDLLLRWAERAAAMTDRKDAAVLDTLARVLWERGDRDAAVAVQREAVAAIAPGASPEHRGSIEDTLREYQRDAAVPAPR